MQQDVLPQITTQHILPPTNKVDILLHTVSTTMNLANFT